MTMTAEVGQGCLIWTASSTKRRRKRNGQCFVRRNWFELWTCLIFWDLMTVIMFAFFYLFCNLNLDYAIYWNKKVTNIIISAWNVWLGTKRHTCCIKKRIYLQTFHKIILTVTEIYIVSVSIFSWQYTGNNNSEVAKFRIVEVTAASVIVRLWVNPNEACTQNAPVNCLLNC